MSGWNVYVKNLIESESSIRRVAIIGAQDGQVWACTAAPLGEDFTASAEELKELVSVFQNINEVPSNGLKLEGTRYIVPRVEENLIFGKRNKTGVFVFKTGKAIIIARFEGDSQEALACRASVEEMGNYLRQQGY